MDYIFFFLVTYTTGSAQSLTGCVVDEQHAPLEFVYVVLFDSTDKKPLAFTRTDADGYFALSCPEGKREYLRLIYSALSRIPSIYSILSRGKPLS